jgi:hypothetical protein
VIGRQVYCVGQGCCLLDYRPGLVVSGGQSFLLFVLCMSQLVSLMPVCGVVFVCFPNSILAFFIICVVQLLSS